MILLLLESALRALLLAVTVWAGLRLFRIRNVLAQKSAWSLVLAAAIAMPLLVFWRPISAFTLHLPATWHIGAAAPSAQSSVTAYAAATPSRAIEAPQSQAANPFHRRAAHLAHTAALPVSRTADLHAFPDTAQTIPVAPERPTPAPEPLKPAAIALGLYVTIATALLGRLFFGLLIAIRLWFSSERFLPDSVDEPAHRLRVRFNFSVTSPVTIGSGILLPADCLTWKPDKLRMVLAHESAHVRQGDFYLQFLAGLYAALFWFSPLGWWLKAHLCELAESISDHAGLQHATSRASYAQILLEFASQTHPTAIGVAMARKNSLPRRIEHLLNESSFRQSFAASPARIFSALLIVPLAFAAATTLVHVQAQTTQSATPPAPAAPAIAPAPAPAPGAAAQAIAPAAPDAAPEPLAPAAPDAASSLASPSPDTVTPEPPPPPVILLDTGSPNGPAIHQMAIARGNSSGTGQSGTPDSDGNVEFGPHKSFFFNLGDSYAYVGDPKQKIIFSGDWNEDMRRQLDKARASAHGKFLFFKHDGKYYIVDDPETVARFAALSIPEVTLDNLQVKLDHEQALLDFDQHKLTLRVDMPTVTVPDLSKEMAQLTESLTKLNAEKGLKVSVDQLASLQERLGQMQARLAEAQASVLASKVNLDLVQGKWTEEQQKLAQDMAKLAQEQVKISIDSGKKTDKILQDAIQSGKARPVQ